MLDPRTVVAMLKAAAEPTRLRILVLLQHSELNVKDLTRILGQSQPRISRHLKLMAEAGLIERSQDGSWAYFQLAEAGPGGALLSGLLERVDRKEQVLARDQVRAEAVRREREAAAQDYFREHAAEWDRIRALHVEEGEVEAALLETLGPGPFRLLVDLGTGTGRMLELLADRCGRGIGLDLNHTMLAYARSKLEAAGLGHAGVRHGDLYDMALPDRSADAVVMHQVLHFLAEPAQALREAARILAPGGRLVIVDFAPHGLEFLREDFSHERLGLAAAQVSEWLQAAGLERIEARALPPASGAGEGKLTVTLWSANRPGRQSSPRADLARPRVEA